MAIIVDFCLHRFFSLSIRTNAKFHHVELHKKEATHAAYTYNYIDSIMCYVLCVFGASVVSVADDETRDEGVNGNNAWMQYAVSL